MGVITILIVLFTVGATGYEYIPFRTTDFNSTISLWYDPIIHDVSWVPKSKTCDASVIKPDEGTVFQGIGTNVA